MLPFRACLASKYAKSANLTQKIKKVPKNQNFMLLQICRKFFDTFLWITFFVWNFLKLLRRIRNQQKILRFLYPYCFFAKKILNFCNFSKLWRQTRTIWFKETKNFFCKDVRKLNFATIKENQVAKIVVPYSTYLISLPNKNDYCRPFLTTCWLTNFVIFVILKHVEALRLTSLRFRCILLPTSRRKIANLVNTGSNFRCDKVLAIFPQAERPTSKEFAPRKKFASL